MRRCIIHIGPHKTGSTSIQKTLYLELVDQGFGYAKLGRANQGTLIHSIFSKASRTLPFHRQRARTDDEIEDYNLSARAMLEESIARTEGRNLIISGEDISAMRPAE